MEIWNTILDCKKYYEDDRIVQCICTLQHPFECICIYTYTHTHTTSQTEHKIVATWK